MRIGCVIQSMMHTVFFRNYSDYSHELLGLEILDAVSCSEDVISMDERTTADVNVVKLLLLQNGHLPRVLA